MSQYSELSETRITLDLLCSVIVADMRASGTEEQRIRDLLHENECPWTDQEVTERIKEFAARAEHDGLELTVENLTFEATLLGGRRLSRAIEECLRLANTDAQRGREVSLLNLQYFGEELIVPSGVLPLSFQAVSGWMVL